MSTPSTFLDFEKPLAEMEKKIAELEAAAAEGGASIEEEVQKLREKSDKQLRDIYTSLGPWQKAQVSRHPERPHFFDYVENLFTDWVELAGDRKFMNDEALVGGLARFKGTPVMVVGHVKGRTTEERIKHNFGMARPEGYRKTYRLYELAERFNLPVIALIDTAGAYPGRGGEERGQAEAIAKSIEKGLTLNTPLISIITGEGGSGGAVALASGNKVFMLEHSIYTVISPEGAASILFRDAARAKDAAEAMKITAADLEKMKIVDAVVEEPIGGAHRAPQDVYTRVSDLLDRSLDELKDLSPEALRKQRKDRFYKIGREGLN
ncbi:acetyl-CoA carboxylase carboxyltransferase subunit alpha [Hirschia baltica]|uniref:Acetyl-coenzyme A carboxylase carboxyl transferase subunit alpha n=1 Tax=Hirschia baltica (strain ATCC 49814 / DSM 5838 / IFAM 1418) TaxID=582402 RepID=C6XPW8_HIRBI|nr:acetyl-CoA carboxylase carboxyltransferase subunit alpha [Hirschia baltica]ACT58485.1 acetyl-CoA carboxylase, carboxyl transferase, alpha subunit [Hirschia baltica ATCC 49814]